MTYPKAVLCAWLRQRLAHRMADEIAHRLGGLEKDCRIEVSLTPDSPWPLLPPQLQAHQRLFVQDTITSLRQRYAFWIRITSVERMIFSLDRLPLPRLRFWMGGGPSTGDKASAFISLPIPDRASFTGAAR